MRNLVLATSILLSMPVTAGDYSLAGSWFNEAEEVAKPVRFIKVGEFYHLHLKEEFVTTYGGPSHTIEQFIKIPVTLKQEFTGTVDVHDSRRCSFKGLAVKGEFQSVSEVNFLFTFPRYQVSKVTTYENGRRWIPRSVRTECQLLEYIEAAASLHRKLR